MTRGTVAATMLSLLLLAGIGNQAMACPVGTIDHSGDVIPYLGRPALLVETCVSESGDMTTFAYRLTNWSRGNLDLCSFNVPGLGQFSAAIQASPMGWTASHGIASECVTWWSWKSGGFVLGPGETLELSLSVDAPAAIGTVDAVVEFCGGVLETASILAPSACAGGFASTAIGCFCDASGVDCHATELFEGEGNRIDLLSGPDEELNAICLGSWVRHGWGGAATPAEEFRFLLTIDGVEIPLERREVCRPGSDVGNADNAVWWHVQFPANHFESGTYEVTGTWAEFEDGSVSYIWYERTITLIMVECMPAYPIAPPLPDLKVRINNMQCACDWTPQQQFKCEVDISLVVSNDGDETAAESGVRIEVNRKSTVRAVPELKPGESHSTLARVSFEMDPQDIDGKCPLEVEVIADYADRIEESSEDNNTDSGCCEP